MFVRRGLKPCRRPCQLFINWLRKKLTTVSCGSYNAARNTLLISWKSTDNVFRSFHTVLCWVHVCCIFIKPFLILNRCQAHPQFHFSSSDELCSLVVCRRSSVLPSVEWQILLLTYRLQERTATSSFSPFNLKLAAITSLHRRCISSKLLRNNRSVTTVLTRL